MLNALRKEKSNYLIYLLFVLAGMNFFTKGSVALLFLCVYTLFFTKVKNLKADFTFLILVAFSLFASASCLLTMPLKSCILEIIKLMNYPLLYLVGRITYAKQKDKRGFFDRVLCCMFLGCFFNIVLTLAYNLIVYGINGRVLYSFWTKGPIAVTLVGVFSSVVIGWSFYALFLSKKRSCIIVAIVALVVMFYINFETATRTPILLFFILYFFMFVILWLNSKQKNVARAIIAFIGLFLAGTCIYILDLFNIQTLLQETPLFQRFSEEGMETGRWEISLKFFKYMPEYFWGGSNISKIVGSLGHSVWLEAYDVYGCFSSLCLIIVTVKIVGNLIKLISRKIKKDVVDYAYIGLAIAILIQCALEPIVTGFPIVFWFLLFLDGMLKERLKARK